MANKWMQKLLKMEGALQERRDVFKDPLKTASPSANFVFGKTHGLPFGYTAVLYGPPKGGKSVLLHMMIGWLHQTDPDAIAVKIDTEFRSEAQLTDDMMALYGIDSERLLIIQTNSPKAAFDQIEKDMAAHCQAGAPIRLIAIDSISGVQGRREMENESVTNQTIGDHAQTVKIGLQRILPVIRKYSIATILIAQARAEMDMAEQKRGNKFKMQAGYGLMHMAEYFVVIEANKNLAGRKDLSGNEFVNEDAKDLAKKGEQTAMKIRVKMKDSSLGPKGRTGELTWHFHRGLVNAHEEVYLLGSNRGIIQNPKQGWYVFNSPSKGEQRWNGERAVLEALENDQVLCDEIIAELIQNDLAGKYAEADAAAATSDSEDESE